MALPTIIPIPINPLRAGPSELADRPVRSVPNPFFVVAVGASAGGLEAFRRLLTDLPANTGMAFILVQHLPPVEDNLLVAALTGYTAMPLQQASQAMLLAPDHIYLSPPGSLFAVKAGFFEVKANDGPHGDQLPFDFLLRSLALERGDRAVCVVLSGAGTDGTIGLREIKAAGGLVIAQSDEAAFDGMPASAIATNMVDLVLPVASMADALMRHRDRATQGIQAVAAPDDHENLIRDIIELVRR